jgi:hypothetical protein
MKAKTNNRRTSSLLATTFKNSKYFLLSYQDSIRTREPHTVAKATYLAYEAGE